MAYIRSNISGTGGGGGSGGGGAFEADANTQITPSTAIVLDQATGNEAALSLDYTTNKATSGDDTGLLINQTDTNSPGASKLLDLQVGGTSQVFIESDGLGHFGASEQNRVRIGYNASPPGGASRMGLFATGGGRLWLAGYANTYFGYDGKTGVSGSSFGFAGNAQGTLDLLLSRAAAAALQLGTDHATVATGQTIKAHDVVTGTGADLTLSGGTGSVANGDVVIEAGASTLTAQATVNSTAILDSSGALIIGKAGSTQFTFGGGSGNASYRPLYPVATYDLGLVTHRWATTYTQALDVAQGTLTDDAQALNLTSTWNDAADTFTLIKADVTDTASAAGSNLMDLQVGGASKVSVDSNGKVIATSELWAGGGTLRIAQAGINLGGYHPLKWYTGGAYAAVGTSLEPGLNTLAQRNGINAQTFNIYNTYTNATDYERGHIGWNDTADTFVIGTEAAGTGVVRDIQIKIGADRVFGVDTTLFNVAIGEGALYGNTTGTYNVATGYQSLYSNTTGGSNVASGVESLYSNTYGSQNTAIGHQSLRSNTSGTGNVAMGSGALSDSTTAFFNVAVGLGALSDNTTGSYNVATGTHSLSWNTTGGYNAATGGKSLWRNTTGSRNAATGYFSLRSNTEGSYNTASGYASLYNNTTGSYNVVSGYYSLYKNTTGSYNVASGNNAGYYQADGTTFLTVADNSIFIGSNTRGADSATNQIVIGDTAIGLGSNTVVLGNDSIVTTALKGSVGIGTTTPATTLDVVGSIAATGTVKTTPTTVALLPAAATAGAGAQTFVTDSANSTSGHHGQTVSGGGANFAPVYSDGTNWLVG